SIRAYRDHGQPAARLEERVDDARRILARLPDVGVNLAAIIPQLEKEGVEKFNAALAHLEAVLDERCRTVPAEPPEQHRHHLSSHAAGGRARFLLSPDQH